MKEQPIVIAALYHFATLDDFESLREPLLKLCQANEIKGTLLLAGEGINGTVAGSRAGIDTLLSYLRSDERLSELSHKESFENKQPFYRMKVRLKKEIVTLGQPGVDPNELVGTYVEPKDWNAIIEDPDTVLIDTRNDYEVEIGTFRGALDPKTESFTEFPDYVKTHLDPAKTKKVAMFCTGGIRCEKASSYMLQQGFEEVYHLKGGILRYLEEVPEEESTWEGECFVFDERVSVNHQLEPGEYELCRGCRNPILDGYRESPLFEENLCCPRCHHLLTPEKRASLAERAKQVHLAEERGVKHIGRVASEK
jgi:UPF0176 protein